MQGRFFPALFRTRKCGPPDGPVVTSFAFSRKIIKIYVRRLSVSNGLPFGICRSCSNRIVGIWPVPFSSLRSGCESTRFAGNEKSGACVGSIRQAMDPVRSGSAMSGNGKNRLSRLSFLPFVSGKRKNVVHLCLTIVSDAAESPSSCWIERNGK